MDEFQANAEATLGQLSNPTSKCEAEPADIMMWTNGKALIATGSPYDPVDMPGSDVKYEVAECNNALVYPGLGMGAIVSEASKITDKMIVAACKVLGEISPARKDPKKPLLPDFAGEIYCMMERFGPTESDSLTACDFLDAQAVNAEIALAVIKQAIDEGVSDLNVPEDKLRDYLHDRIWKPEYAEYEYTKDGQSF